ncbi:hypothetical protein ABG960_11725, partial [Enterococcus faecalis]
MRILILSAPKGGTFLNKKNLLTYQSMAALLLVFSLFSFDPSVSFATRSGKTPVSVELEHSLLGIITFQLTGGYARYDKTLRRFFMTNTMYGLDFSEDPAAPDFPTNPIIIGNGATLMSNAGDRKGQGMWSGRMTDISLAIQTPVSQ